MVLNLYLLRYKETVTALTTALYNNDDLSIYVRAFGNQYCSQEYMIIFGFSITNYIYLGCTCR